MQSFVRVLHLFTDAVLWLLAIGFTAIDSLNLAFSPPFCYNSKVTINLCEVTGDCS